MDLKQLLEDLRDVQSNLDSGYHEEAENLLNFVIGELAVALTNISDIELLKAEHQLTGFAHASQGFDIISLIESMALHVEEWYQLRGEQWVTDKMWEDVDAYFGGMD